LNNYRSFQSSAVFFIFFLPPLQFHYMHAFFNILFPTQPLLIMVPLKSKSKVAIWVLSSHIYAYQLPSTFQETTHKSRSGGGRRKKKSYSTLLKPTVYLKKVIPKKYKKFGRENFTKKKKKKKKKRKRKNIFQASTSNSQCHTEHSLLF
jgi:hypothetical protein